MSKFIVHLDMDAFFAAIEQRDNPTLRGKPVIVGADPKRGKGRGVVSTCSYEARGFGLHSAMPISTAFKLCPGGIFLPVDMEKYEKVSGQIYEIFYEFTPKIEPVSIDEAFLDITASYHIFGSPLKTAELIKSRVKKETGLTASVGLAPSKMVAKIASDLGKPDGLIEIRQDKVLEFLWPLSVDKIWGLGKKTRAILNTMGIKTIGDLASQDKNTLIEVFGKNGVYYWKLANGIDEREVQISEEVKSISNEITFDKDTSEALKIKGALFALCEKVSDRLRWAGLKGKTVTLKIRLEGFHTYTRAKTIYKATNFFDVIYQEIKKLYDDFKVKNRKVRLLGVKVSNLLPSDVKDSLFKDSEEDRKENLHQALSKIKEKFGKDSIFRAQTKLQDN